MWWKYVFVHETRSSLCPDVPTGGTYRERLLSCVSHAIGKLEVLALCGLPLGGRRLCCPKKDSSVLQILQWCFHRVTLIVLSFSTNLVTLLTTNTHSRTLMVSFCAARVGGGERKVCLSVCLLDAFACHRGSDKTPHKRAQQLTDFPAVFGRLSDFMPPRERSILFSPNFVLLSSPRILIPCTQT